MKIAVLGRTRWLVEAGDLLRQAGYNIVAVATAEPEQFYQCGPEEFELLSLRCNADYLGIASLSNPAVRARLAAARAELAVSINWPVVLDAPVLDLFPRGVLNLHCGDLPRYRGNACANWAILNGETQIGLCVHLMTPGEVDSGPVLLREFLPISENTYIGDVYAWLDRRGPVLLFEAASGYARGDIAPVPQPDDPTLALRCYPRRPEDGRIDWRDPVERIHRLVRASSRPFAGAFAHLEDGRRVTIWRARPFLHATPFCAVPGQVMLRSEGDPVIACGAGALRLEEVEVEGMPREDSKATVGRSLRCRLR